MERVHGEQLVEVPDPNLEEQAMGPVIENNSYEGTFTPDEDIEQIVNNDKSM